MMLMTQLFGPLLEFLARQTGSEAKAAWPKGPVSNYREADGVPVVRYAGWLRNVENSPALAGETATMIAQRIRRLYFSRFTEEKKPGVGERSDDVISEKTPYVDPPLTTDHVDQATLDGLYNTSTIVTARGIKVDVAHVWLPVDLALANATMYADIGEIWPLDSILEALFSWAGDLGAVANTWSQEARRLPANQRQQRLITLVNGHATRDDLLGDMDGVILARYWDRTFGGPDPFIVSADFLKYYTDDAMPQAQAAQLAYPNSARRFHHFMAVADPSLTADGKNSTPLTVTMDVADVTDDLKPIIEDAADDLIGLCFRAPAEIDAAGREHFEKLCENFAKFLKAGLTNGIADWPPTPW